MRKLSYFFLLLLLVSACGKKNEPSTDWIDQQVAYQSYVSAYTYGTVSSGAPIKVRFVNAVSDEDQKSLNLAKIMSLEPSAKGTFSWADANTLVFQAEEGLAPGTHYLAKVQLDELFNDIPDDLHTFTFGFQTITQNFSIEVERLQAENPSDVSKQQIEGVLKTADRISEEQAEKLMQADQEGSKLSIEWTHDKQGLVHRFLIKGITRGSSASSVSLAYNGEVLGIEKEGEESIRIPSLNEFSLIASKVIHYPEQYVLLQFSDPLFAKQNLEGLVEVADVYELRSVQHNQEIKIYFNERITGDKVVHVLSGIKNYQNASLPQEYSLQLRFEQVSPAVRFIGKGTILPSTNGLVLPFEAVNLRAVMVQIIKVYESNMVQFFQVNDYEGYSQLRRVGKEVTRKIVALDASGVTNLSEWNRFTLDLSELMKAEPGALYQVRLSIRKEFSVFGCNGENAEAVPLDESLIAPNDNRYSTFDAWDSYNEYYYSEDYDWRERENPCHSSYYNNSRSVHKNLLASDIGAIAKKGNNGTLTIIATNLLTANPLKGAEVSLINFQQKEITQATTDGDGVATFAQLNETPFIAKVKQGDQTIYIKLDDANSLSVSSFNVGGEMVQQGLKGFIYGERGVWRPGDSLHLSFILEDLEKKLPLNHPVTLELYTPMGQLYQKMVKNTPVGNIYRFSTRTEDEAITGNWRAVVKVGGTSFSKKVKIESIKPNRLKIDLDFGKEKLRADDASLTGKLSVKWLTGAIAKNLKAEFEVLYTATKTSFKGYDGFVFDDPSKSFNSEREEIFSGYTNEQGQAQFNASLAKNQQSPGMLTAHFSGKVYEEGGDFSIDNFSLPYYPYSSFVGIKLPELSSYGMLVTGKDHALQIATVNSSGEPISKQNVRVTVYKLDWRWWWDQSEGTFSNYISRDYYKVVYGGTVNTSNGKGTFNLRINEPEWGRYFIHVEDPSSGHSSGEIVYIDWPSYAGRESRQNPDGASILTLSTDKQKYETGDNMVISFEGSDKGKALISIENGSKVLSTQWIDTEKGLNEVSLEVKPEMAPNVYAHISLLQPHAQTENDLPMRMYGIVPIEVENKATHLLPVISAPKSTSPDKKTTIEIQEKDGKAMAYTLAVVDEGLLDITGFKTPNPWSNFYAREALGVKTWDIYEEVIGAYGGRLEHILTIGGDEETTAPKNLKANRFKPTVHYLGPFYLDKGGKKTHTISISDYVGSVKIMAVAAHPSGAYGSAEAVMEVKQPLMVLATLPRVLGPGEKVKLPVNVFVMEEGIKSIQASITVNDAFKKPITTQQSLSFSGTGDQTVYFDLETQTKIGVGTVKVQVQSGNNKAQTEIEIQVRTPNPSITQIQNGIVEAGKNLELNYSMSGLEGTNSAYLEVSQLPAINLRQRLGYLMNYPHGCIEQTVSAVFPQLYLSSFIDLSETEQSKTQNNINAAIERLKKFQHPEGGFTYWPGADQPDAWGSNYAGHFLLEAKKKGYFVPDDMLNQWKAYQRKTANNWSRNSAFFNSDLIQSYRLYTLALAGEAPMGALNRLRESSNRSLQGSWMLATAYAVLGQDAAVEELINTLDKTVAKYQEMSYSYGSNLRDEAIILECLIRLKKTEEYPYLLKKLAEELGKKDQWMSTQTTAFLLRAIALYLSENGEDENGEFSVRLANEKEETISLKKALWTKNVSVSPSTGKISIQNKGGATLFVRIIQTGTPLAGEEKAQENDLKMTVRYTNMNGESINPSQLAQGTNFMAEVTVYNPGTRGNYEEMALSQIFPSGWEIINTRLNDTQTYYGQEAPEYQDIRDDRVYTYFDLGAAQRKTIKVQLNATYQGRFYLPAVSCGAMYDNSVQAVVPGQWVEVIK
ncbi:MG2 domain-containing protein [Cytophagales bacterium LB-30]|uniref:MG2 domain-containing protein n=1 Tax=Shiella aurantiaca TaxID=3058365 RepID=A0ABT8F4G5_9BACT|nr:MG2 domain-containing protein [Shiella aurantiaca]MDN4165278.1 MG2 domain-containing protein [Shiella aurantiaca]